MDNSYIYALKNGQKYYRKCISRGQYPYLPILDELLPLHKLHTGIDLGVVSVPAEMIIGTKTSGRSHSFAGNFMPLTEENSEFAGKWKSLCESHLNEGIHDPVVLYEYMNRYYVEEGNKRVSVLKFFDAVTIAARVKRILPEASNDPAVLIYNEYLQFYKKSTINFLEFSKRGSYQEFLNVMGKQDDDIWTEEEIRIFRGRYYTFKNAFVDCGGEHLRMTTGDALLVFLKIYGADSLKGTSDEYIRRRLLKIWQEITLLQEDRKIELKLEPEETEASVLTRLLPRKRIKAAFLYSTKPEDSDWISSHEMGRIQMEESMAGKVETEVYICENEKETQFALQKAIGNKAEVIFAVSAEMLDVCLKIAVENPEILILNCSLNDAHRYIRMYYPRMYEAKFISGAIAGALCENQKIGYIGRYPIFGSIAEINAFARGVQMTNTNAKVYLEWLGEKGPQDALQKMREKDIHLISFGNRIRKDKDERFMFGLTYENNGTYTPVAYSVLNWGKYYERILTSIRDGTFQNEEKRTIKALNYFWGMSAGVVEMMYSRKLPDGIRALGELLYRAISRGECYPFYHETQKDCRQTSWDMQANIMGMEEIINMDWLDSNVVGKIPVYEELDNKAKSIVNVMGVGSARKKDKTKECTKMRNKNEGTGSSR